MIGIARMPEFGAEMKEVMICEACAGLFSFDALLSINFLGL
jgi:hypothetical protein